MTQLIVITTLLGAATWVLVTGLLLFGVLGGRRNAPGPAGGVLFVLAGGVAFPGVVILGLWVYGGLTLAATEEGVDDPEVVIEVVGNQWWWEARYPNQDVVTANEIHIPTDEPVLVRLTTDDVIHSFWVPQLIGKRDLIPGQETSLWLEADEPGIYRGQCAEFCGVQHARMAFHVVAEPPQDFQQWAEDQAAPAEEVEGMLQEGQQVFLGAGCPACHTIRGTQAAGEIGPDLTHLASRRYIAAGTLPLTRGSLGGWILDPQTQKPGNLMPPTQLTAEQLDQLLTYLMSLE